MTPIFCVMVCNKVVRTPRGRPVIGCWENCKTWLRYYRGGKLVRYVEGTPVSAASRSARA